MEPFLFLLLLPPLLPPLPPPTYLVEELRVCVLECLLHGGGSIRRSVVRRLQHVERELAGGEAGGSSTTVTVEYGKEGLEERREGGMEGGRRKGE